MLDQPDILPWHEALWARIARILAADKLPHALLLHGPAGVGKLSFANRLAGILICREPVAGLDSIKPCGLCTPCKQQSAVGARADVMRLELGEGERQIKIEQARDAIRFANQTAHYGGRKVLVVHPADSMNHNTANAMLKTLEEPPPGTVLILVTTQPARLLPTIRSRCQHLRFTYPAHDSSIKWLLHKGINQPANILAEANNAPIHALRMAEEKSIDWRYDRDMELHRLITERRSPSRLAQHWLQFEYRDIYEWLYDRVRRAQWANHGVQPEPGSSAELNELSLSLSLVDNEQLHGQLMLLATTLFNNINKQLCLESILFSLMEAAAADSKTV